MRLGDCFSRPGSPLQNRHIYRNVILNEVKNLACTAPNNLIIRQLQRVSNKILRYAQDDTFIIFGCILQQPRAGLEMTHALIDSKNSNR